MKFIKINADRESISALREMRDFGFERRLPEDEEICDRLARSSAVPGETPR